MLEHAAEAIRKAVTFPLIDDDHRIRRLVIGSGLIATSILLIPLVILGGYYVRYLRVSAQDDPEPPRFDEWRTLLTDGVKLFGLVVAVGVGVGAFALVGALAGQVGVLAVETLGAVGGLVAALLAVLVLGAFALFLVTVPAMISNFAVEGRLGSAFDLDRTSAVMTTPIYLVLLLFAFFVNQIGVVFGGGFAIVLVGFPIAFYAQLVALGLVGRGFAHSVGVVTPGTDEDPTRTDPVSTKTDDESTEQSGPTTTVASDGVDTQGSPSSIPDGSESSDTPSASGESQSGEGADGAR